MLTCNSDNWQHSNQEFLWPQCFPSPPAHDGLCRYVLQTDSYVHCILRAQARNALKVQLERMMIHVSNSCSQKALHGHFTMTDSNQALWGLTTVKGKL